jgi:hypothetical protein
VWFGLVPLAIAGRYHLGKQWNAGLQLRFAANIPTLASSPSDAAASIGRDIRIGASVGRALPRWRRFTPHVELTLGWEWLTTKLSDTGVVAGRSWNGPAAAMEVFVDVCSRGAWSLGPVLASTRGCSRTSISTHRPGAPADPRRPRSTAGRFSPFASHAASEAVRGRVSRPAMSCRRVPFRYTTANVAEKRVRSRLARRGRMWPRLSLAPERSQSAGGSPPVVSCGRRAGAGPLLRVRRGLSR